MGGSGEENSLHGKEGAQRGVCPAVKYLGRSAGRNKITVPALPLPFKEVERDGVGGKAKSRVTALVGKNAMQGQFKTNKQTKKHL